MTRALQQKIHVGCRQLGLDREARHDLQLAVTGKASMADMSETDLQKLLDRLKADGFKPTGHNGPRRKSKAKLAPRKDLRLVHVLWTKLGEAKALKDPSRAGLNKFIRARFGKTWGSLPADVDMLRDHTQIDDLIQALKSWGLRADIDFDWAEHRR